MFENLTREQLIFILEEVVRTCTYSKDYHIEKIEEIEEELHNKPDDETFYELIRSRSWNNGGLDDVQDILHIVQHLANTNN